MNIDQISELFNSHNLREGRMISGGKISPPGHVCVFNANIIIPSLGKVWYGDIDITKDGNKLIKIADTIREMIFVLRESGCRFGTANDPVDVLIGRAVWNTSQEIPYDKSE